MAKEPKDMAIGGIGGLPTGEITSPMLPPDLQVYPLLKLLQSSSKEEGARPGAFHLSATGDIYDSVKCVFLKWDMTRTMFGKNIGDPLLCGSNDRVMPSDQIREPKATTCMECPFHRRGYTEPVDQGNPIACDESFDMIGYLIDDALPFRFRTRKLANLTVQQFITTVQWGKMKKLDIYNHVVTITSKIKNSPKGSYHIPILSVTSTIQRGELRKLFEELSTKTIEINPEPEDDEEGNI